jgi:hypothetical protein
MVCFLLDETREQRTHGQPMHVTSMNAGEQRLCQIGRRLGAKPSRHERPD